MQIPILLERIAGDGYRARGAEPFAVTAKGATREEALAKIREKIEARLKEGAELVGLEIGSEANPWVEFAGMFKGDPLIDEWKKAMADYRNKVDEDADYP
jgi:predicted RNase H-like HicB family nuclease